MLRWIGFALGLAVVVSAFGSVVGTLVVPRGVTSIASKACARAIDLLFRGITLKVTSYQQRDRILAWQAPVVLIARLMLWMGMLYIGYALMLLPVVSGSVGHSFSESGSSM